MLDGIYLHFITKEIAEAVGCRVDRIHQPTREELILTLRGPGGVRRLLISSVASAARLHFTEEQVDNPPAPPMFCMLMRKHLGGARLVSVRQQGFDRIVFLEFDNRNDFGDVVRLTLCVEIMGRHSNIILIGEDGRVVDSIKRVDAEMSSVRQVLPGIQYELPPMQPKLRFLEDSPEQMVARVRAEGADRPLSAVLMSVVDGISPLTGREAAFAATHGDDPLLSGVSDEDFRRLQVFLTGISDRIRQNLPEPVVLISPEDGPKDFSYLPIRQYGGALTAKPCESVSQAVELYYAEKAGAQRLKQRGGEMIRQVQTLFDRIQRKIAAQQEELLQCKDREELRQKGELLNANAYQIERGMTGVSLPNFYDPDGGEMFIKLDPRLTPQKNAQRYYSDYRKAATAERMLTGLIERGEAELEYVESVLDSLHRSATLGELDEIRAELTEQGYLKRRGSQKQKRQTTGGLIRYRTDDGFTILIGRNNLQNDRLTFKEAQHFDIWFHAKDMPGSHVVVITEGRPVPDAVLETAAVLAARHSKGGRSGQVPVDYTEVRNVKKPPGSKPGKAIYVKYQTVFVHPDADRPVTLEKNNG